MGYHNVNDILNEKYKGSNIRLEELKDENKVCLVQDKPDTDYKSYASFVRICEHFGSSRIIETEEEYNQSIQTKQREDIIHNANVIKKILDEGAKIVSSVTVKRYSNDTQNGLHAICIAGYKINERGFMDVQIIDPQIGVQWISLEHLSSCIVPFNTYKISKAN